MATKQPSLRTRSNVHRGYITVVFRFGDGGAARAEAFAAQLCARLWIGMGDGRVHHNPNLDGRRSVRVVCDATTDTLSDREIRRALARELRMAFRQGRIMSRAAYRQNEVVFCTL